MRVLSHFKLGPLLRTVANDATWQDDFPPHQEWADEIEKLLCFDQGEEVEVMRHRLSLLSLEKHKLEIHDAILSFALSDNQEWIRAYNPLLSDAQIETLNSKIFS